jgi:hypothetical protein
MVIKWWKSMKIMHFMGSLYEFIWVFFWVFRDLNYRDFLNWDLVLSDFMMIFHDDRIRCIGKTIVPPGVWIKQLMVYQFFFRFKVFLFFQFQVPGLVCHTWLGLCNKYQHLLVMSRGKKSNIKQDNTVMAIY